MTRVQLPRRRPADQAERGEREHHDHEHRGDRPMRRWERSDDGRQQERQQNRDGDRDEERLRQVREIAMTSTVPKNVSHVLPNRTPSCT
jgi:hypothetical protein